MSISAALLEKLRQKSAAYGYPGNSWDGYAVILRFLDAAIQRVPSLEKLDAWDTDEIDRVFEAEVEHLAATVVEIFPTHGCRELEYYVPETELIQGPARPGELLREHEERRLLP